MSSQNCPFCDRVFATPEYDNPRNSVIAHAVSLADDNHQGVGYTQARNLVDGEEKETPDVDDVQEPTVDADRDDRARADGAGLGLGGPVPVDDDTDLEESDDVQEEPETVDCPRCNTDTELRPEDHQEGQRYQCDECGGSYKWT